MVVGIKGWEQYPWLWAGFSDRWGGVSAVYGEPAQLNLGWTKEDTAAHVAENRRRLVTALGSGSNWDLVTMRQVHGDTVHAIGWDTGPLATADGKAMLEGDGLITAESGLLLGAQTADCVPVLIADIRLRAVAALHAGWRGTVARIAEMGVAAMRREFGSRPEDMVAAIGPAILQCCFAVGDEVRDRFAAEFEYAEELFLEEDQFCVDLHAANRRQLIEAGIRPSEISMISDCTACKRLSDGRRAYFSHRAEKGVTGRMMSVIGIAESK